MALVVCLAAALAGCKSPDAGPGKPPDSGYPPKYGTDANGVIQAEDARLVNLDTLGAYTPTPAPGIRGLVANDAAPVDGKVRVIIYEAMDCADCKDFREKYRSALDDSLDRERIVVDHRIIARNSESDDDQYGKRAANALACMAHDAPKGYVRYLDRLYGRLAGDTSGGSVSGTDEVIGEGGPGLSDRTLVAYAKDVATGVYGDKAGEARGKNLGKCIEQRWFVDWVEAGTRQAASDGVGSLPAVVVGGKVWDPKQHPDFGTWLKQKIAY
jgi:protein-disulfide isomerase